MTTPFGDALPAELTGQPPQPIVVPPPPEETPVAQRVAEILLAAYALDKTIDLIVKAIKGTLGIVISENAVRSALGLAQHAAAARPVLRAYDISRRAEDRVAADLVRKVAHQDVYYRALYVVNAARRIATDTQEIGFREAQRKEKRHYEAHRRARDKRLDAAAKVGLAAVQFGVTLGWYRNWALDSDVDCIVADGHNFDATEGTVIGWPGSVHANCGCSAGPPHADAISVNEALASWGRTPVRRQRRTA